MVTPEDQQLMDLLGQAAADHLKTDVTAIMVQAPDPTITPEQRANTDALFGNASPAPAVDPGQRRETLDALVNEWLDRKAAAEKEAAGLAEVAELIGRHLKPGEKHEVVPGVGVQMKRPNRAFDQEAALALLSEADLVQCEVRDISWSMVKALLKDRGVLDQAMKQGSGRGSLVQL